MALKSETKKFIADGKYCCGILGYEEVQEKRGQTSEESSF
jgi:hypothetical protein